MQNEPSLLASAYHEAGHAVIAWRHHIWVRERGITLNDDLSGNCHVHRKAFPGLLNMFKNSNNPRLIKGYRLDIQADVEICLAGPLAEKRFRKIRNSNGKLLFPGAEDDLNQAMAFLEDIGINPDGLYLFFACQKVNRLLRYSKTWVAVTQVAEALMSRKFLESEEVYQMLADINPPREKIFAI